MANYTISKNQSQTSTTSKMETKQARQRKMKLFKLYKFIDTTYREIRKHIPGLGTTNINEAAIMECVNNYKRCFQEIYETEDALEYFEVCGELAQNVCRTLDLFKTITVTLTNVSFLKALNKWILKSWSELDEYYHRVCELLSIFIACELRLSVDSDVDLSIIASRIIFLMKRHLTQEDEEATRYNILLTLVSVPRLFNAREIVCKIYEEFLPLKANIKPTALPDKLYVMHIIIFYRWMSMKTLDEDKKHIVDMAEKFMKPMVSLCNNGLYVPYLPGYTTHSTATRAILSNLKTYQDLRTASIIDNAYKHSGAVVNLCDDDEIVIIDESHESLSFSVIFSAVQLEPTKAPCSIVKHEIDTIIDSIDLTVDDESDTIEKPIVEKFEKWLYNFQVMAKQLKESETRARWQKDISAIKVISLASDDSSSSTENEEIVFLPATNSKTIGCKDKQKSSDIAKQTNQNESEINLPDDLFIDNYPLTITPIRTTADIETSDAEDETQLSREILPATLRTYESKKNQSSRMAEMQQSFLNTSHSTQDNMTNSRHRAENLNRFNLSPLGTASMYSNDPLPTTMPGRNSEFSRFGECNFVPSWPSNSLNKQQEHVEAAPTLFRNIFDRNGGSCRMFLNTSTHNLSSGDLISSSMGGRPNLSLLSPSSGYSEEQNKKRNKIHTLMQRRATLSCRSDFDDYMAALHTSKEMPPLNDNINVDPAPGLYPGYLEEQHAALYSADEKLRQNCAVIIQPTAELIQYERKRDAMYNELLQKQRRKMELRAIEKMKEKERRRQEKEMKRDQYMREQMEAMEKLEKMEINPTFNKNLFIGDNPEKSLPLCQEESQKQEKYQSHKRNENICEFHSNTKNIVPSEESVNKLFINPLTDNIKASKQQIDLHMLKSKNFCEKGTEVLHQESHTESPAELTATLEKKENKFNTLEPQQKRTRVRKQRQTAIKLSNNSKQYTNGTRRQSSCSTSVKQADDEYVPGVSSYQKGRRKKVDKSVKVDKADSEKEDESNITRQSLRLRPSGNITSTPQTAVQRKRKTKVKKVMQECKSKANVHKIKDVDKLECKISDESRENNEASIVASIAKSLSSPAPLIVEKPLASAEQEEILNTLEDFLENESRQKSGPGDNKLSSMTSKSSTQSLAGTGPPPPTLPVDDQVKSTNFSNNCKTIKGDQSKLLHIETVQNSKKLLDEQYLQNILEKSVSVITSLSSTTSNKPDDDPPLPILISRVESLNTSLEENDALGTNSGPSSQSLVTENILLNKGGLETTKDLVNTRDYLPMSSSLLTDVETSIIQADISDISPTLINIDIATIEEEDNTMAHNIKNDLNPEVNHLTSLNANQNHFVMSNDNLPGNKIALSVNKNQTDTNERELINENFHGSSRVNKNQTYKNGRELFNENCYLSSHDYRREEENKLNLPPHTSLQSFAENLSTSKGDSQTQICSGNAKSEENSKKLDTDMDSRLHGQVICASDEVRNSLKNSDESPSASRLMFPITNACYILLKRLKLKSSSITLEEYNLMEEEELQEKTNEQEAMEPESNIASNVDDCNNLALSSLSPACSLNEEDCPKIIVESHGHGLLPSILKSSSSSTKSKDSQTKIVRFNPLAQVIPITPCQCDTKKSIYCRDDTPPPENFYREHNYVNQSTPHSKLITPATRKLFYDVNVVQEDMYSSSSSEDCRDNEMDIVLACSAGEKDLKRKIFKNLHLQRVLLVPPDDTFSSASLTITDLQPLKEKTDNITDYPSDGENSSHASNGIKQFEGNAINNPACNHILSNARNAENENNLSKCSDNNQNVLVSSTYLTNISSSTIVNPLVPNTIQFSMTSPSEHEVTSTQETETDFPTNVICLEAGNEEGCSSLLQNNQVDTTNNSPEIYTQSTRNFNESNGLSPFCAGYNQLGDEETFLTRNVNEKSFTPDLNQINEEAYGSLNRLSPSTTTVNDDNMPAQGIDTNYSQNSKPSKTKTNDPRKIQHNSTLMHRNPFIARPSSTNQRSQNLIENHLEQLTPQDPKRPDNSSESNEPCKTQHSKECSFEFNDCPKELNVLEKSEIHHNSQVETKFISSHSSSNASHITQITTAKKKVKLVRPKPYTTRSPQTSTAELRIQKTLATDKNPENNLRFAPHFSSLPQHSESLSVDNNCDKSFENIMKTFKTIKLKPAANCQNPLTNNLPFSSGFEIPEDNTSISMVNQNLSGMSTPINEIEKSLEKNVKHIMKKSVMEEAIEQEIQSLANELLGGGGEQQKEQNSYSVTNDFCENKNNKPYKSYNEEKNTNNKKQLNEKVNSLKIRTDEIEIEKEERDMNNKKQFVEKENSLKIGPDDVSEIHTKNNKLKKKNIIEFEGPIAEIQYKTETNVKGQSLMQGDCNHLEMFSRGFKNKHKTRDNRKSSHHNDKKSNANSLSKVGIKKSSNIKEIKSDLPKSLNVNENRKNFDLKIQNNLETDKQGIFKKILVQESKSKEVNTIQKVHVMDFTSSLEATIAGDNKVEGGVKDDNLSRKSKDIGKNLIPNSSQREKKHLKRSATADIDNSLIESYKKSKLVSNAFQNDIIIQDKCKLKKHKKSIQTDTDPLEINDDICKNAIPTMKQYKTKEKQTSRTEIEGEKSITKTTTGNKQERKQKSKIISADFNETKRKAIMAEFTQTTTQRQKKPKYVTKFVEKADVETEIKVSTKSRTIVAVKMIPFSKIYDAKEETKNPPINEIVAVKLVKANKTNECNPTKNHDKHKFRNKKDQQISVQKSTNENKNSSDLSSESNATLKSSDLSSNASSHNNSNFSSINEGPTNPSEITNSLHKVKDRKAITCNSPTTTAVVAVTARKRSKNSI